MENSYEALYTGVYLFVFVAAMTIAVYLFQGVNDLANNSYDYGKVVTGDAVIETDTEEAKYLSKTDVISYYMNYIKRDNYESTVTSNIKVKIDGISQENLTYSALLIKLNKEKYYISEGPSSGEFVIRSLE